MRRGWCRTLKDVVLRPGHMPEWKAGRVTLVLGMGEHFEEVVG